MLILKIFERQNRIQIYIKTHQIAPFKKLFSGGMPPNPPNKARRTAPHDTSHKRDEYFTPILSPPCLNMDICPWCLCSY